MSGLQKFVVALLLIAVGLEAGVIFGSIAGDIPAIRAMDLDHYVVYWQAVDLRMGARMPVLSLAIVVLYLSALAVFARRRGFFFWALLGCMAINVCAIVYTVTQQVPVNHAVQALDLAPLDLVKAQRLREATVQHFFVRAWLTIGSFVLLTFAVVSRPVRVGSEVADPG